MEKALARAFSSSVLRRLIADASASAVVPDDVVNSPLGRFPSMPVCSALHSEKRVKRITTIAQDDVKIGAEVSGIISFIEQ